MPNYRYYATDLLTGQVLAELPLYGVWFSRTLSASGQITGTYKLGTGMYLDSDLLVATMPGKCAVYVERDNTLIWGGIIWSRTYASESKTMQLSGQTFESVFGKTVIESDFVQQSVEQVTVFKNLVNTIQAQAGNNFGIDISQLNSVNSGVLRTFLIPNYEYHFANEVVDGLVGVDNGLDYTIDIQPSDIQDQPLKVMRVGWPTIGQVNAQAQLIYDYPGNITDYYWPESAGAGATKAAVLGAGNGNQVLRSVAAAADLLAQGYPSWWVVNTYKLLGTQQQVNDKSVADINKYKTPLSTPTFNLKPDAAASFDAWSALGTSFVSHIEDDRFPGGKDIISRMIGWELTTSDSDDTELLKIIVEGDGDA